MYTPSLGLHILSQVRNLGTDIDQHGHSHLACGQPTPHSNGAQTDSLDGSNGVLRVVEVGERREGAVQDAAAGWEGMEARVRWGA